MSENKMNIKKWQLVQSRAGRDKGRFYLIYSWDLEYLYLVDGNVRRIQTLKKKNVNHVWYTTKIAENLQNKESSGHRVTNLDISETVARLTGVEDVKNG